ncbi:MAG: HAD-IA family hydrolase [Bacteroidetes bacterium]|nr:HAD-IA family hydrolase [Bacteroidota bacterium]MBU1372724.1 HAD-IA family hydrolase [Bacteroidota bacterium]MBU1484920.1 HAD-IA family hydrolase [Bacteroidota bacterium]MBU1759900.1 HAD-IA family hydrolase [Bacteroidota bacterium]MBU2046824.1 HAD-IA family hydrolase [Bacteroidota bacterium]
MDNLNLSEIKVVFMDIGGVLLSNGWGHESRQKAAEFFGFDYEEMNVLHNFIYNVFEIGGVSLDDYLDTVVFHVPRDFTRADFKAFMYAQSVELPDMLAWAKSWKKNTALPVFALSNESKEINAYRIATFRLHDLFDGFFSSCYLGLRKPNPKIFQTVMEIVQAKPQECIYFDDRLMLVNAAKKLGINGIHHQSFEATKKIIENII